MTGRDPAVVDWLAALREVIGREPAQFTPDRRNPFEVARDEQLEDRAEERAAARRGDYMTGEDADAAADRYYDNGGPQL